MTTELKELPALTLVQSNRYAELPRQVNRRDLVRFLHENMVPFEDPIPAIECGLDVALSDDPGRGGFVLLALEEERLVGASVIVGTGLEKCVPENLLLFVAVDPELRGRGIGSVLIRRSIAACEGDVKLHVEYDNPAVRLYARLGFVNKYADMRYIK